MNVIINKMLLSDLYKIKNILSEDFDDFWTYDILEEELKSKNSKYIVAKIDDEIVGFAGIKIIMDEADIMNIVTKKSYRNQGIGALLLENLIILSNNLKLSSLTLEVNQKNFIAIHMYEKFDFKLAGLRKNYYQNENGYIMKKKLN